MGVTVLPYFTVLLHHTYLQLFKYSAREHKELQITTYYERMLQQIFRSLKVSELKDILGSNFV